jgi:hypothetical protein
MPSYGNAASTTGPHDISFLGRGGAYVTIGLGFEGQPRSALAGVGDQFGWLVHVPASGAWPPIADIAAYEFAANPGGGPLDSNPYGLLAEPGSRVLADAGANALLRVATNGDISTLAVFPSRAQGRSTDAVPTAVAVGPDGSLYVLEHSIGPVFFALPGRLLKVAPDGTRTTVIDGLTRPGSVAVGPDGALYVSNRSTSIGTGEVLRIEP